MKTILIAALLLLSACNPSVYWSTTRYTATGKVNVMRSMYAYNTRPHTTTRITKRGYCPAMQQNNPVKLKTVRTLKRG